MPNPEDIGSQYTGYQIPEEILEGDFRRPEGGPDPNFAAALEYVMRNLSGRPDLDLVDAVYLEFSRVQEAFKDVHLKNLREEVSARAYFEVADYFQQRLGYLLSGETYPPAQE